MLGQYAVSFSVGRSGIESRLVNIVAVNEQGIFSMSFETQVLLGGRQEAFESGFSQGSLRGVITLGVRQRGKDAGFE